MTKTMEEKCADHARVAARHVKMKALDTHKAGGALMAEGLALIFGVDGALASFLAIVCSGHAAHLLMTRVIEQAKQDGVSEADMAALLNSLAEAEGRGH